ncbi:MAG: hypothetical protein C0489_08335 [Candidatus Accumulibacter sp.]|nr:hypothetical protein [Accumulibacter sp.]MBA4094083.1 hypothetical protein [Accumulibacter sp.]
MPESINFDFSRITSGQATGTNNSGTSSQLAALKKQLIVLQKKFLEKLRTPTQEAAKEAKLIQMQMQIVEARIAQLLAKQTAEASKADNEENANGINAVNSVSASSKTPTAKAPDRTKGNNVNEYA